MYFSETDLPKFGLVFLASLIRLCAVIGSALVMLQLPTCPAKAIQLRNGTLQSIYMFFWYGRKVFSTICVSASYIYNKQVSFMDRRN